jgi:anhydro-N-acetylmuramic acid kinase
LASYSIPYSKELKAKFLKLREIAQASNGDTKLIQDKFNKTDSNALSNLHKDYITLVVESVENLIKHAKQNLSISEVDIIGFHGQTCAHNPPSISKSKEKSYTLQFGNGHVLADFTRIPVVYDFRSDDIFNGGEGAPLAPMHHRNLANSLKGKGYFPIAFLNAGNTGNISIISRDRNTRKEILLGFDVGPCNHYIDSLMRQEMNLDCDENGDISKKGNVNTFLLKALFDISVTNPRGENLLLNKPPKSFDPQWYKLIPELTSSSSINFEDRLRTATYFSAYLFYYALGLVDSNIEIPKTFALCGGGWKNKTLLGHLQSLFSVSLDIQVILPEHQAHFNIVKKRLGENVTIKFSKDFGFDDHYMEARIFADAAVCKIKNQPFSLPEVTGVKTPTVLGTLCFPDNRIETCPQILKEYLNNMQDPLANKSNSFWSRASSL